MPKSFLLKDFPDISDAQFTDLGRVTVVCGKNNSGKTRLLTALATKNKKDKQALEYVVPTVNLESDREFLGEVLDKIEHFANRSIYRQKEEVRERLLSTFPTKSIWRKDELSELLLLIVQDIDRINRLGYDRPSGVERALEEMMPFASDAIVLVPPKRTLPAYQDSRETSVDVQGNGVIAALFNAKNKNRSHPERKLFEEFCSAFTFVTSDYQIDVEVDGDSAKLSVSEDGEHWQFADEVGLGFRDIVVILYFAIHSKHSLVMIEEPENHLHPEIQRKLLEFLAGRNDKQFILTTHSSIFLDSRFASKMFLTQKVEGQIQVSDITSKALALNELGYDVADNVVSDMVILAEGPSDIPVIEEFLRKKGLTENYSIKFWFLGGDTMDRVDLTVLAQSYKIMALVDNDPGSESVRRKFLENCEHLGIDVARLEKYAIENYFTLEALRKEYGGQIPSDVTEIDSKKKLEEQIRFNVKKKNFNIARAMSLEDVEGTDFGEFLDRVEQLLQQEQLEEKVDAQSN